VWGPRQPVVRLAGLSRPGWLVLLVLLVAVPDARAANQTLKLLGPQREFVPGDAVRLLGHSWFGPISNCRNRVAIGLRDAAGRKHRLGAIGPEYTSTFGIGSQTVKNFWDIGGSLELPEGGVTPGPASLIAVQRIRFRIPFTSICFQVARKQARINGLTIAGPTGDQPPQIDELVVPDMRQGRSAAMSWRSSEAGHTMVKLTYLFTPGQPLEIATILDEPRPAGTNTLDRPVTLSGAPLPAGSYRIELRVRDAGGSLSAPLRREFAMGFG